MLMNTPHQITDSTRIKFIIGTTIASVVALLVLYFTILKVSILETASTFQMYVPSRSGGMTYDLDATEFTILNCIVIGIILFSAAMAIWSVRKKQWTAAHALNLGILGVTAFFGILPFGNFLYQQSGATAATIGVIVTLFIWLILSNFTILKFLLKKNSAAPHNESK
jgi:uncharacterized BrkB/YihY/UPF0761 family membrane protein